jgi:hypothetical protein
LSDSEIYIGLELMGALNPNNRTFKKYVAVPLGENEIILKGM